MADPGAVLVAPPPGGAGAGVLPGAPDPAGAGAADHHLPGAGLGVIGGLDDLILRRGGDLRLFPGPRGPGEPRWPGPGGLRLADRIRLGGCRADIMAPGASPARL